jgi:hypothetical protein
MRHTVRKDVSKKKPHLESVEGSIALKRQLVLNPITRAQVFSVETHEEHRVYRVNNRVADPASLREVGAFVTDWVVFVIAHGVSLIR